jgi:hypothetical protein
VSFKTCSINQCEEKSYCRGLCGMHYTRWRRHGDPLVSARKNRPLNCSVLGCEHGGRIILGVIINPLQARIRI